MSATTAQAPLIPPRPVRGSEKSTMPAIPPRPSKNRLDRSVSPNPDRFAPSPLNDPHPYKPPVSSRLSVDLGGAPLERSTSVDLPSLGQEGIEYAGVADEPSTSRSNSPEHTRTVGDDVKLHAPKPSLPAASAKQRVMAVTRTDSDKAASFGIGRRSSQEVLHGPPYGSIKKKGSTTSQLSDNHHDEEHGIPEIGQQVPMMPFAGDVQAPSPAPSEAKRHHARKTSSRGALPPGSYGLHGHGVASLDKLEKAYYDKHPELLKKEHTLHHHDRAQDFSLSSEDLNKIVHGTARSGGLEARSRGTPSEQVGWQAMESSSRVTSPRPASFDGKSPLKSTFKPSSPEAQRAVIHVDEPNLRRRSVMFSDDGKPEEDDDYRAPILAEDELEKDPLSYEQAPAVELDPDRRGSNGEESVSRPTSRPASLYKEPSFEHRSTPLEDVEEYEPLFPEDKTAGVSQPKEQRRVSEHKQRFPSRDIWEDAPSSHHYTAEVSTPDLPADNETREGYTSMPTPRNGETAAQAFARRQEELAEKEASQRGPDGFLTGNKQQKPSWIQHQSHLASESPAARGLTRPSVGQRFPSRDVWEDTPDSLKLETTVSTPDVATSDAATPDAADDEDRTESKFGAEQQVSQDQSTEPSSATSDSQKPVIPDRPKPRQTSNDETGKPVIPDRPKPQVPSRPAKSGPTSGGTESAESEAAPPRQKPAVPARPVGSKIAALQAGFMSELNNRLRIGPQAPKKEEPAADEAPAEEKEKAPLSDARKGRARGPQRRAPAKSPSPVTSAAEETSAAPKFSFSIPTIIFEIDPEEEALSMGNKTSLAPVQEKEEGAEAAPAVSQPSTEAAAGEAEPAAEAPKSLATNLAGEPVVEVSLDKKTEGEVEPVGVEEH